MTNEEMQEKLYEASYYADAISTLAGEYDDNPSYSLLAAKCSDVICEVADSMWNRRAQP